MSLPFSKYVKNKHKYCIGYLYNNPEILKTLKAAKTTLEEKFPINIVLVTDKGQENTISYNDFIENINNYIYIRYIDDENIDAFLKENNFGA